MKKITLPLLLFIITALLALPGAAQETKEKREPYKTFSFDMKSGGNLQVNTSGGSITVTGTSDNKASVEMYVSGRNGKMEKPEIEERLKDYTYTVKIDKGLLVVDAKPNESKNDYTDGLSISFSIKVPRKTASTLNTNGGSIAMVNLDGASNIQTSGGSIAVKSYAGNLDAKTSGGSISLTDGSGSLKVFTSGGSINLHNVSGDVDAHTSGGSIKADIMNLGKFLTLETNGGSVTATIPKGKGLNLDLSGSSVHADLGTNFKGVNEKNKIKGSVNGGGIPVKMSTSGGSAKLIYRS